MNQGTMLGSKDSLEPDEPGPSNAGIEDSRLTVSTSRRVNRKRRFKDDDDNVLLPPSTLNAQKEERERLERVIKQREKRGVEDAYSLDWDGESGEKPTKEVEVIDISSDDEDDIQIARVLIKSKRPPPLFSDLDRLVKNDMECLQEQERRKNRRNSIDLESTEICEGRLLINGSKPDGDPDIYIAKHLTNVLKPHQIGGIRFMYDNVVDSIQRFSTSPGYGCILAHVMGLGKTVQVIAFIEAFLRATAAEKVLIIVPVNTIRNWMNEFDKFMPRVDEDGAPVRGFEVYVLDDTVKTAQERCDIIGEWYSGRKGVLVMGYDLFRLLVSVKPVAPLKKTSSPVKSEKANGMPKKKEEMDGVNLSKIRRALLDPGPDLVVCDEGHRIKNEKAEITAALSRIRTRRRIVLTGYPLQNNLMEYYCMVNFVRPDYLGTRKYFRDYFEKPISNAICSDASPQEKLKAVKRTYILNDLLKGFVQRRTQSLLKEILPPIHHYVLPIKKSSKQAVIYAGFVAHCLSEALGTEAGLVNALKAHAIATKIWNHSDILYETFLKKKTLEGTKRAADQENVPCSCNAARDGTRVANGDLEEISNTVTYDWAEDLLNGYKPGLIENGPKMRVALDIIDKSTRIGDKVLIFSQSLMTLDLLEKFMQKYGVMHRPNCSLPWKRNITYFRFDGSTSATERENLIRQFNEDPSIGAFLISTKAGSLGINLTAANRVIIFDISWNPCHDSQATCRVYRFGQKKHTYTYRLVTANSMEKAIFNRQIGKNGLQKRVVDDKHTDAVVTKKELEELLSYNPLADHFNNEVCREPWACEDDILTAVFTNRLDCFFQYPFLHESLLMEREVKLSADQIRDAYAEYEIEKNGYGSSANDALSWNFNTPNCFGRDSSMLPIGSFYSRHHISFSNPASVPRRATPLPMRLAGCSGSDRCDDGRPVPNSREQSGSKLTQLPENKGISDDDVICLD